MCIATFFTRFKPAGPASHLLSKLHVDLSNCDTGEVLHIGPGNLEHLAYGVTRKASGELYSGNTFFINGGEYSVAVEDGGATGLTVGYS